eukprot:425768-Amphidinium_carterae.1
MEHMQDRGATPTSALDEATGSSDEFIPLASQWLQPLKTQGVEQSRWRRSAMPKATAAAVPRCATASRSNEPPVDTSCCPDYLKDILPLLPDWLQRALLPLDVPLWRIVLDPGKRPLVYMCEQPWAVELVALNISRLEHRPSKCDNLDNWNFSSVAAVIDMPS